MATQPSYTDACAKIYSRAYAEHMLGIYIQVVAFSKPNFLDAMVPLPANLHFHKWEHIAHTDTDGETIQFLGFGFPAGYEGPIPNPMTSNHPSTLLHPQRCSNLHRKGTRQGSDVGTLQFYTILPLVPDKPTSYPAQT